MSKIKTLEQGVEECINLWEQIEKECIDKGIYNISRIKYRLIGEKEYVSDCPLCEYTGKSSKCPLHFGSSFCGHGCLELGYDGIMTTEEVKQFVIAIKEKLKVEE